MKQKTSKARKRSSKEVSPRPSIGQIIGEKVRAAREKKGLTQSDLGLISGRTGEEAGSYISRIETGVYRPRVDTLVEIARALKVPVSELMP